MEYVSELSVMDISMLRFPPSLIAAAAVHVALASTEREDTYPSALERHAGYGLSEVRRSMRAGSAAVQRWEAVGCRNPHAACVCRRMLASCVLSGLFACVCASAPCTGPNAPQLLRAQVLPAAHALVALMRKAPTASLNAVHKKFCSNKYGEVAKQAPPELEAKDESGC